MDSIKKASSGHMGLPLGCAEIGAAGYPPTGPETANFNLVIGHDAVDPISGSVPMRAYVCQIERISELEAASD